MRTSSRHIAIHVLTLVIFGGAATCGAAADEKASETNPFNESFEKTDEDPNELIEWVVITKNAEHVGTDSDHARTGDQSLCVRALTEPDAYQAIVRTIPIDDREKYTFTVYAMNDREEPLKGGISAQLVVEWRNGDNEELGREYTRRWDQSLSRKRWKEYKLRKLRPPKGSTKAVVGVHVFEGVHGGKGGFYVDDFSAAID